MMVVQARRGAPTPLAIRRDELPETVSLPTAVVRGVTFIAFAYVLCAALSLGMHNYFAFGIALGVPIVIWHSFRRAKQTERELGGTLWAPTRIAWTSQGRGWFVVTETEPADAVESWD